MRSIPSGHTQPCSFQQPSASCFSCSCFAVTQNWQLVRQGCNLHNRARMLGGNIAASSPQQPFGFPVTHSAPNGLTASCFISSKACRCSHAGRQNAAFTCDRRLLSTRCFQGALACFRVPEEGKLDFQLDDEVVEAYN